MQLLSLNELLSYVRSLGFESRQVAVSEGLSVGCKKDIGSALLANQFCLIINFPEFDIDYISPNIKHILKLDANQLNIKELYGLVHVHDLPVVLLASKKMVEFLLRNLAQIEVLKVIATLDFRLRTGEGRYVRVLNQNTLLSKSIDNSSCQTMSIYSDISHFKSSKKIEFDYVNYGSPLSFDFPDKELSNISLFFTSREREILSLLAIGKNSQEIGESLFISKHTVDTHRRNMLAKSHLCNTAELVAFAINNQLF